jgi:hypothetical protein
MAARAANTTRFVHVLAVAAGVIVAPLALLFAKFVVDILGAGAQGAGLIIPPAVFLSYACVGALFGLVWPENSWRWGVWVGLLPFVWASFISPLVTLALAGMVLLPACAGASAASRWRLRRVGVNRIRQAPASHVV